MAAIQGTQFVRHRPSLGKRGGGGELDNERSSTVPYSSFTFLNLSVDAYLNFVFCYLEFLGQIAELPTSKNVPAVRALIIDYTA